MSRLSYKVYRCVTVNLFYFYGLKVNANMNFFYILQKIIDIPKRLKSGCSKEQVYIFMPI